ncbi:MAG: radical SAM protein [Thermodesulfobacteriota bacterium]
MDVLAPLDMGAYRRCELCPRMCKADRTSGERGFCGESNVLRIAAIEAHFGEEPPITGENGSGTVFFSGCSLRCDYCQNHQISRDGLGQAWPVEDAVGRIAWLHRTEQIHNVNLVTPDHFFPHAAAIIQRLREKGVRIPVVFNTSGYQRVESLRAMEPFVDVYLPDFKYSDRSLANDLSRCPDYPATALDAIAEMVRQKGLLRCTHRPWARKEGEGGVDEPLSLAVTGVLVRHLILPGLVRNSCDALTMLFLEFGGDLPLSIMSQYAPVRPSHRHPSLNRGITIGELHQVLDHAQSLGFRDMFVQTPQECAGPFGTERPFVPDFRRSRPFLGNVR